MHVSVLPLHVSVSSIHSPEFFYVGTALSMLPLSPVQGGKGGELCSGEEGCCS